MTHLAADVALAFNGANERKTWTARPWTNGTTGKESVHFTTTQNLVTIVYECEPDRFHVRFNKVHASWGDYVKAIARSLYVVLTTLKVAGLPFDAPEGPEGVEIVVTASADATTYVRWPGQRVTTVAEATMPELYGEYVPMRDEKEPS